MLNIVIFGAPGSGKGTQSDKLIEHYKLFHISTGDVLRDNIKRGTELGKTAKGYIDQGQLVPDELIIDILAQVLDENKEQATEGVIFDGFPRTIPQAEALEQMLADSRDPQSKKMYMDKAEELHAKAHPVKADDKTTEPQEDFESYYARREEEKTGALKARKLSEEEMIAVGRNSAVAALAVNVILGALLWLAAGASSSSS